MRKLFWFNFAFLCHNGSYTSIAMGFDTKKITTLRIIETMKNIKNGKDAVLLSCSYLGHMTSAEMAGIDQTTHKEDTE